MVLRNGPTRAVPKKSHRKNKYDTTESSRVEYLPQWRHWGESIGGPDRPYLAVWIRQATVQKAPLNHTQSALAPSNSTTSKGCSHEGPLCLTRSLGRKMLLSLCPNTYRIVPLASQWEHLFPDTHGALRGRLQGDGCAPRAQCTLVTLCSSFLHAYERVRWLLHKPVLTFDLITYSLQGEDKIILEKQEDASFDHRYATLSEACVSLRQDHGRLIPGVLGLFFHYPINQSIQVCRYQVKMLHLFGRDASQSDTIARVCHSWPDIVLAQQMFYFDRYTSVVTSPIEFVFGLPKHRFVSL